ncbi:hypothetical protein EYZ11_012079 [Aspergillus tanneri]|uniref:Uncharacterized protein n=1 Tax=Aspergillus tanneri TaxID=1220188 RepID=A0A4S3J3A2_9EURO|nr:hypothetical protein EYZ11_012079 [Aspergillus tanneri]
MRRFDFKGDDAQYVSFLEDIVQKSGLLQPAKLPPSTEGHTHSAYVSSRNRHQHTPPTSEDEETMVSRQLRIIQYDPFETEKSNRLRPSKERWQKELDRLLSLVPNIEALDTKAQEMGLGDNQIVISSLVDGFIIGNHGGPDATSIPLPDSGFVLALRKYALFTKKSHNEARLLSCLARFQELVFVSFCDVALGLGEAKDRVHDAMRLYISNSEGRNLDKIISGARWVNRCITSLSITPWGSRSPEIFILGGQTTNFYGRYAETGYKCTPYFLNLLQQRAKGFSAGTTADLTRDLFQRYYDGKFTGLNSQQTPPSPPKRRGNTNFCVNSRQAKRRAPTDYSKRHISKSIHEIVRIPQLGPLAGRHNSEQIYTDRNDSTSSPAISTGDGCPDPDTFHRVAREPPDFDVFQFDSSQAQFGIPPEFDVFESPSAQSCYPPEFNIFRFDSPSARLNIPSIFSDIQSDPPTGAQFDVFQFDSLCNTNDGAADISRGLDLEGQNAVGPSLPSNIQV